MVIIPEYYQYLYLTFFVQTGLDQGDGELPVSEEREVALQYQHKLLRVPLLQCQQQILKIKRKLDFFFCYLTLICISILPLCQDPSE